MANNIALQRLQREFKDIVSDAEVAQTGIEMRQLNDSLTEFYTSIRGPPDSPYATGKFELDVRIPDTYPFQPPIIKFRTRIWHPNISSQTGLICLDILKDQWAASMTLRSVLLSIQMLLTAPEPNDPQDAVVASQYMNNKQMFLETARFWTQHFANGEGEKNPEFVKRIAQLNEMGAKPGESLQVLSCNNWDVARATESLFS